DSRRLVAHLRGRSCGAHPSVRIGAVTLLLSKQSTTKSLGMEECKVERRQNGARSRLPALSPSSTITPCPIRPTHFPRGGIDEFCTEPAGGLAGLCWPGRGDGFG